MTVFLALALMAIAPILFALTVYHVLHGTIMGLLLVAVCLSLLLLIPLGIA